MMKSCSKSIGFVKIATFSNMFFVKWYLAIHPSFGEKPFVYSSGEHC